MRPAYGLVLAGLMVPVAASFDEEDDDGGRSCGHPNEQQPHEDTLGAERDR